MRIYRMTALALAVAFAAVGLVFLFAPGALQGAFDSLGRQAGIKGMPVGDAESGLFRVLAVAYMYVVTILAWMMFRRPADPVWPALLAQAKFASALVSILLFALAGPYLVYAANGVVDGLIGVAVLLLRRHLAPPRSSPVGGWR